MRAPAADSLTMSRWRNSVSSIALRDCKGVPRFFCREGTLPSMGRTYSNAHAARDPPRNHPQLGEITRWGQLCTYIAHEGSLPTWGPRCPSCNILKLHGQLVQESQVTWPYFVRHTRQIRAI